MWTNDLLIVFRTTILSSSVCSRLLLFVQLYNQTIFPLIRNTLKSIGVVIYLLLVTILSADFSSVDCPILSVLIESHTAVHFRSIYILKRSGTTFTDTLGQSDWGIVILQNYLVSLCNINVIDAIKSYSNRYQHRTPSEHSLHDNITEQLTHMIILDNPIPRNISMQSIIIIIMIY